MQEPLTRPGAQRGGEAEEREDALEGLLEGLTRADLEPRAWNRTLERLAERLDAAGPLARERIWRGIMKPASSRAQRAWWIDYGQPAKGTPPEDPEARRVWAADQYAIPVAPGDYRYLRKGTDALGEWEDVDVPAVLRVRLRDLHALMQRDNRLARQARDARVLELRALAAQAAPPASPPPAGETGKPLGRKSGRQRQRNWWLHEALTLLRDNPDRPNASIARELGIHPSALSRGDARVTLSMARDRAERPGVIANGTADGLSWQDPEDARQLPESAHKRKRSNPGDDVPSRR
jgi:hypothetical protein